MSPRGIEIERKFRLRAAPDATALAAHNAVAKRIEQVYLQLDPAETGPEAPEAARVRRTELADGEVTFRRTTKRRVGAFSFDEVESVITFEEWTAELTRADPHRRPVRKTRYVVAHGDQALEIDVFETPPDLVVVEVELHAEDEAIVLPPWLGEWREVTGDPRYLNVSLARLDADVPPFEG
jgi:CYTH domain-containing protein